MLVRFCRGLPKDQTGALHMRGLKGRAIAKPLYHSVVLYLPLARKKGEKLNKQEAKFNLGIFASIRDDSDELYILMEDGAVKTRTVRRLKPSERHNKELPSKVKGTPWKPVPSSDSEGEGAIGIKIDPLQFAGPLAARLKQDSEIPTTRGFYTKRVDLEH